LTRQAKGNEAGTVGIQGSECRDLPAGAACQPCLPHFPAVAGRLLLPETLFLLRIRVDWSPCLPTCRSAWGLAASILGSQRLVNLGTLEGKGQIGSRRGSVMFENLTIPRPGGLGWLTSQVKLEILGQLA
jgi:hypothetical protein